jgi:hypothetical protein
MLLEEFQEDTLAHGLGRNGWQQVGAAPSRFVLTDSDAVVEMCARHGEWEMFLLQGSAIATTTNERLLSDNRHLNGPLKWVHAGKGAPLCRIDVPRHWPTAGKGGAEEFGSSWHLSPRQAWAAAVTDFVRQQSAEAADALPLGALAEQLQRAGWAATVDEGQLRVHLAMPELYCEIRLEHCGPAQVRIAADLTALDDLSAVSRRAVLALAASANARLPLVRYAVAADATPALLTAEVCLSVPCALVPGGWLLTAVEVVETAVLLTAREMQALRDPELAKLVLAAAAADEAKEG